jgi:hypothetical protein
MALKASCRLKYRLVGGLDPPALFLGPTLPEILQNEQIWI